jgi:hypothetical protein
LVLEVLGRLLLVELESNVRWPGDRSNKSDDAPTTSPISRDATSSTSDRAGFCVIVTVRDRDPVAETDGV